MYIVGYDDWKLACCGNYPDCSNCPYEQEEEEELYRLCKGQEEVFEGELEPVIKYTEKITGFEDLGVSMDEVNDSLEELNSDYYLQEVE